MCRYNYRKHSHPMHLDLPATTSILYSIRWCQVFSDLDQWSFFGVDSSSHHSVDRIYPPTLAIVQYSVDVLKAICNVFEMWIQNPRSDNVVTSLPLPVDRICCSRLDAFPIDESYFIFHRDTPQNSSPPRSISSILENDRQKCRINTFSWMQPEWMSSCMINLSFCINLSFSWNHGWWMGERKKYSMDS